jgi:phosphoribosylformimino-5-aminoimidazole carboxamide ribotide isomerase
MEIIPVIDLRGGVAVHARRGQRELYRPLDSPLCAGNSGREVVEGYLRLFPFRSIYVADLDAIEGRGTNDLAGLAARFPEVSFWADAGFADLSSARRLARGNLHAVLGTESLRAPPSFDALHDGSLILSLDHRDGAYVGPPGLPGRPDLWPDRVIVMTLARVGSGQGPDADLLKGFRSRAPRARLFAAGGVRDRGDLEAMASFGIDGALVATSLHEGRIGRADLEALAR